MKAEIRKLLDTGKLIIGSERTLKELRTGALEKVIVASNCAADVRSEIDGLAGQRKVAIDVAAEDNEGLGVLCKKPFRISVLGIKA